ncbi:MAG: universal stress protein [Candidatus Binataceae bacterium]
MRASNGCFGKDRDSRTNRAIPPSRFAGDKTARRRSDHYATHGRKGFRRLILGSVAEQAVPQALCPVLTVKPKPARTGTSRTRPRNAERALKATR